MQIEDGGEVGVDAFEGCEVGARLIKITGGDAPSPIHPPPGCPFHPRCPIAEARCRTDVPALREVEPGRLAACHLAENSDGVVDEAGF